ncbi:hypothetical protein IF1G_09641 [Cordyceps javanica]|uniref:Uncharacterized protein n=1 Tax=Cordyceps javanica TaxID=43265 RepID=A0A545UQ32_9HYPO|nr:hypothetical protein IF1G_09641 [Cordyceps javanica]
MADLTSSQVVENVALYLNPNYRAEWWVTVLWVKPELTDPRCYRHPCLVFKRGGDDGLFVSFQCRYTKENKQHTAQWTDRNPYKADPQAKTVPLGQLRIKATAGELLAFFRPRFPIWHRKHKEKFNCRMFVVCALQDLHRGGAISESQYGLGAAAVQTRGFRCGEITHHGDSEQASKQMDD